ncbi:hypothetical protein [Magnetococcus sp. PR-3]|uniref:hypothetical protein n=1 Tax=Magnetococcus sp. PR-3 TaxID=3120355 RepID=UPI002FCDF076
MDPMDPMDFELEHQGADIRPCPYCGWRNTPAGFRNHRPYYECKGCQTCYTELTQAQQKKVEEP